MCSRACAPCAARLFHAKILSLSRRRVRCSTQQAAAAATRAAATRAAAARCCRDTRRAAATHDGGALCCVSVLVFVSVCLSVCRGSRSSRWRRRHGRRRQRRGSALRRETGLLTHSRELSPERRPSIAKRGAHSSNRQHASANSICCERVLRRAIETSRAAADPRCVASSLFLAAVDPLSCSRVVCSIRTIRLRRGGRRDSSALRGILRDSARDSSGFLQEVIISRR